MKIFTFKRFVLFLIFSLSFCFLEAQKDEDLRYEMKHKNHSWFKNMKDGANYFEIKNEYDTYFGNHRWEKSKPRALGESWIKDKIYYLDSKGIVQPEPKYNLLNTFNTPLNTVGSTTTTQIGSWTFLGTVNSATTSY